MTRTLAGRISALRRFLATIALAAGLVAGPASAGDFMPQLGNYFNDDEPGWGLDIQLADPDQFGADNLIFVIWFTYREDGTPIWYLAVGALDGMSWSGNLDVFTWAVETQDFTSETVGTIALEWTNASDATFSWDLDNLAAKGTVTGERAVSFAEFAEGPTHVDYSGHHFPPDLPGWGMSVLTQGDVSVGTMYFYDADGQPTWIQGIDADSDFELDMDMRYFTGDDLCPACLSGAQKGGGFESVDLATVHMAYARRFKETPVRMDDLDLFFGINHNFVTVNPDTPLGDSPFSFAPDEIPIRFPGGGPHRPFMPLTPVPTALTDDEIDTIVMLTDFRMSGFITPDLSPPICPGNLPTNLSIELDPDGYGPLLTDAGNDVFFIDELSRPWNVPVEVSVFRPGDETIALMLQGALDDFPLNAFHTLLFSGPAEDFFNDPTTMSLFQTISGRFSRIFNVPPEFFLWLNPGPVEQKCAEARL